MFFTSPGIQSPNWILSVILFPLSEIRMLSRLLFAQVIQIHTTTEISFIATDAQNK